MRGVKVGGILRAGVLPGVLDSGFASLAAFAIGIYAIRTFEPELLGAFALVFSALNLVAVVPAQLLLVPAEARLVDLSPGDRLILLPRTLATAAPVAALAAAAVGAWLPFRPPGAELRPLLALTVTAAACAFVSPLQDHVRRVLHSGKRSWWAAGVSAAHLTATVAGVLGLMAAGVDSAWIPLGALAGGNVVSLALAVARRPREFTGEPGLRLDARQLARGGGWLVTTGLLPPATGFAVGVLVTRLAGAAALGHAEAARVASHPVFVLAMGLSAVWTPRAMEAARSRSRVEGNRVLRRYAFVLSTFSFGYLLLFGIDWSLNPLARLLPTAYAVPGLMAAMTVATVANALLLTHRAELVAGEREAALFRADLCASVARFVAGFAATTIHAFAIPFGLAAFALTRWPVYRRLRRQCYHEPEAHRVASPAEAATGRIA